MRIEHILTFINQTASNIIQLSITLRSIVIIFDIYEKRIIIGYNNKNC